MRASEAVEDFIEEQKLRNNRPATIAHCEKGLCILLD